MALVAGHRLGPYEIEAPIGAGGMGEVYRARDVRLERTVAIKVLPERVAADSSLRERFEREARAVASLTHPHICTLHDIGRQEGVSYLVMEYLEGETLAARLGRAAAGSGSRLGLPLETAMAYAVQIADALDRAHRQGIVHRDLKPHNIMITKGGIKLLDFGLAKIEAAGAETAHGDRDAQDRSRVQTQATLTGQGLMLGTLQYMAPEQVEGQPADTRSDIFALGAIIYEMITGQRPFVAKGHASLIAAILNHEPPPMAGVQPMVPPALERIVRQCLAKEPDDRWQSVADLKRELQWIAQGGSHIGTPAPVAERRRRRARIGRVLIAASLLVAGASIVVAMRLLRTPAVSDAALIHFEIPLRGEVDAYRMALSPDGRRLVFGMPDADGKDQLWLRALDGFSPVPIPGTEGARDPFWSPDGRYLAFAADGKLKKTDLAGGKPQAICDLPRGMAGGSWGTRDLIVFGASPGNLFKVSAEGGTPALAMPEAARTKAGATMRRRPWFLPDGERFVYLDASRDQQRTGLWLGSLNGSTSPRFLTEAASMAAFAPEGYLLYARGGALVARPFDVGRGELTGGEIPIAEGLAVDSFGGAAGFAVSNAGVIAYGGPGTSRQQLTWIDRQGKVEKPFGEPGRYENFDLSPDGTKIVVAIPNARTGLAGIWIIDGKRDVSTLLVEDPRTTLNDPIWSPDGQRVAFTSRGLEPSILARPAIGGKDEVLFQMNDGYPLVEDWSRDGKQLAILVVADENPVQRGAILNLPPPGEKAAPPVLLDTPERADELHLSPDGRWLAYGTAPTGRWEVFVTSNPPRPERWQISTDGGVQPRWRADGRELYYLAPDGAMMAVDVRASSATKVDAGIPRKLFETSLRPRAGYDQYAVTGDGERFLLSLPVQQRDFPSLHVLVNWTAAFRKSD